MYEILKLNVFYEMCMHDTANSRTRERKKTKRIINTMISWYRSGK